MATVVAEQAVKPPTAVAWRRLFAFVLDLVVLGIAGMLLGVLLHDTLAALHAWGRLVGFVIALLYFGTMNSALGGGQTLGKMVMQIAVVGREGLPLPLAVSFLRSAILCVPWFLNGVPISAELLTSWLMIIPSLLVFGAGVGILYLFLCNRRTRQSLHDLAVGSFVVRSATPAAALSPPPLWRGHVIGLLVIGVLAAAMPIVTGPLVQGDLFGPLLRLQQALDAEPGVHNVGVLLSTNTVEGNDGPIKTNGIEIQVSTDAANLENQSFINRVATVILEAYPQAAGRDFMTISLKHGYDIGISESWEARTYSHTPAEWQQVVGAAL